MFPTLRVFVTPVRSDPINSSPRYLKWEHHAVIQRWLTDNKFSRFDTMHQYDAETDKQTDWLPL